MRADLFNLTPEEAAKATKTLDKLFADLARSQEKRTTATTEPGTPGPSLVHLHYRKGVLVSGDQAWRRDHGGRRKGIGKKK